MKLFLARELIDGTHRKAMTPARRQRCLEANGNVCAFDGCEVSTKLEIDHIIPLALGGKDEDGNLIPLCHDHHKQKTRKDIWQIAKSKRQRKLVEEREPSKRPIRSNPTIPSRPFQKRRAM